MRFLRANGHQGTNHRLLVLWREVRALIEQRWPNANRSSNDRFGHLPRELLDEFDIMLRREGQLDRVEALIKALHEIDPRGKSFRYPGTIPAHIKSVSLEKLAESALELDSDGWSTGAYEEDSARAETEAEFRAEVQSEYGEAAD